MTHVYWVNNADGTVRMAQLDGGGEAVLANNQSLPGDLCVDSSNVYWINHASGEIHAYTLDGGATRLLAVSIGTPWNIVVHSGSLYWGTESGTLETVSSQGGQVTIVRNIPGSSPGGLSTDDNYLYSVDRNTGDIDRVNFADGGATTLASGSWGTGGYINAASGGVFWSYSQGYIFWLPAGAPSPILISEGEQYPQGVVADSNFVYWADYDTGQIRAVSLATREEFVIYSGGDHPNRMAQTPTSIYWEDQGNGDIMAAPKCHLPDGGC